MRYALIADGTSDRVLIPILNWCHRQHSVKPAEIQWVDTSRIPRETSASRRLATALDLFPCDVLIVHRDAEGQPAEVRRNEIATAALGISVPHLPVIPVRMTEAWLLFDEGAIRCAAGNPNGTADLQIPPVGRLEGLVDPKQVLFMALRIASELNNRRRNALRPHERAQQIPSYIDDFSPLRSLLAFRQLENDMRVCVESLH